MPNTTSKKYYDEANQVIDEQAILDKYNAATTAQFNVQREQNRQAENKFYNQMYNTQKTAMDTIRQSNAAAVSTGASRGVQAANELSALLGLQEESVASATELAQANRQTAQEETAAVLENVLQAYQQAQQEKAQYVQHAIEAASVENEQAAAAANAQRLNQDALQSALQTNPNAYLVELAAQGYDYSTYSTEGQASLNAVVTAVPSAVGGAGATQPFNELDWDYNFTGESKAVQAENYLINICKAYGLDPADFAGDFALLRRTAKTPADEGKRSSQANATNNIYNNIVTKIITKYSEKQQA